MTPSQAVEYLLNIPRFARVGADAYKPGLERVYRLMDAMGNPHLRYPVVHVAGTNGKGSTASLVAAVGTALGLRTGLHTSPHLFDLSERMRIDGAPVSGDWLARAVETFRGLFEETEASFFEATMALCMVYFAESSVDWAVVEVGLGGRLDATNVVQPEVTAITRIGLDHQEFLGSDLASIAREKAGIIKPGVPVFTSASDPEAVGVLESAALVAGSPLECLGRDFRHEGASGDANGLTVRLVSGGGFSEFVHVGLSGMHQAENAALALAVSEHVWGARTGFVEAVRTGFAGVRRLSGLRGRCEVLAEEPLIVADVAHNPDGLAAALTFVRDLRPASSAGRLVVAMGVMKDKPAAEMTALLRDASVSRVLSVPIDTPRALPADRLCAIARDAGLSCEAVRDARAAVRSFRSGAGAKDSLLIVGSHMVVGQLAGEQWSDER